MPFEHDLIAHPQWHTELQRKLAEQSDQARIDVLGKLAAAKAQDKVDLAKDIEKLRADSGVSPTHGLLPIELLPGLEVKFTPDELKAIASFEPLAREVYVQVTGIHNPRKTQIERFQEKIANRYPEFVPPPYVRGFEEERRRALERPGRTPLPPPPYVRGFEEERRRALDPEFVSPPAARPGRTPLPPPPYYVPEFKEERRTHLQRLAALRLAALRGEIGKISPSVDLAHLQRLIDSEKLLRRNISTLESRKGSLPPAQREAASKAAHRTLQKVEGEIGKISTSTPLQRLIDSEAAIRGAHRTIQSEKLLGRNISTLESREVTLPPAQREALEAAIRGAHRTIQEVKGEIGKISPFSFERRPEARALPAESSPTQAPRPPEALRIPNHLGAAERSGLFKRLNLEGEEKRAREKYGTLAAVPREHKEAEEMMRHSIESRETDAKKAKARLEELRNPDTYPSGQRHLDIFKTGPEGWEDEAHMKARIARHRSPHSTEEALKILKEKADIEWREKIAPQIGGFWGRIHPHGSGAHSHALEKARLRHDEQLRHAMFDLQEKAEDKALHRADIEHQRSLEAAQTQSTLSHQRKAHAHTVEEMALRERAMEDAGRQEGISALAHLGAQKQAQRQREISERLGKEEQEIVRPLHLLTQEAALASSLHPPTFQSMLAPPTHAAHIPAPSLAQAGAGMLGTLGRHFLGSSFAPQESATGGRIKGKKFAEGGMPQWKKLTDDIEHDQHLQRQEEIAKQFNKPPRFNYLHNWIGNAGNALLSDLTHERPLELLGKAGTKTSEDQDTHEHNAMLYKAKSFDFYDKMRQSLQDQRNFLADHDLKREGLEETKRYHHGRLGEAQRHNEEVNRHHRELESSASMRSSSITKEDKKKIDELKDNLKKQIQLQESIEKLEPVWAKLKNTGPNIGWLIKNKWDNTAATVGGMPLKDIQRARMGTKNVVLELQQSMRNIPRAEAFVKRIDETKPDFENIPEVNMAGLSDFKNMSKQTQAYIIDAMKDKGMTDQDINSYIHKIKDAGSHEKYTSHHHAERAHDVRNDPAHYSDEEISAMYQKVK
jgi:hypothetical protein